MKKTFLDAERELARAARAALPYLPNGEVKDRLWHAVMVMYTLDCERALCALAALLKEKDNA